MAAKALKERDDVKVMTEEELEDREFELKQEQEQIRSLCSIVELDSLNQNACKELFTYLDVDKNGLLDSSDFDNLEKYAICKTDKQNVAQKRMWMERVATALSLDKRADQSDESADLDGDNKIDYFEFVEAIKKYALSQPGWATQGAGPIPMNQALSFEIMIQGITANINHNLLAFFKSVAQARA